MQAKNGLQEIFKIIESSLTELLENELAPQQLEELLTDLKKKTEKELDDNSES